MAPIADAGMRPASGRGAGRRARVAVVPSRTEGEGRGGPDRERMRETRPAVEPSQIPSGRGPIGSRPREPARRGRRPRRPRSGSRSDGIDDRERSRRPIGRDEARGDPGPGRRPAWVAAVPIAEAGRWAASGRGPGGRGEGREVAVAEEGRRRRGGPWSRTQGRRPAAIAIRGPRGEARGDREGRGEARGDRGAEGRGPRVAAAPAPDAGATARGGPGRRRQGRGSRRPPGRCRGEASERTRHDLRREIKTTSFEDVGVA